MVYGYLPKREREKKEKLMTSLYMYVGERPGINHISRNKIQIKKLNHQMRDVNVTSILQDVTSSMCVYTTSMCYYPLNFYLHEMCSYATVAISENYWLKGKAGPKFRYVKKKETNFPCKIRNVGWEMRKI